VPARERNPPLRLLTGALASSMRDMYSARAGTESHHQPSGGNDAYNASPATAAMIESPQTCANETRRKIS